MIGLTADAGDHFKKRATIPLAPCMSRRRNWDPPAPSPASECAPPPGPKGGGTLACGRGGWRVPIPTTGLVLCLLCALYQHHINKIKIQESGAVETKYIKQFNRLTV